MKLFNKILISNRGEIAVRVIRTARQMGIQTVSVFADDDSYSQHVSMADDAILLEGKSLAETYLNQDKIIQIALAQGADAIHPGYGFLSENSSFAAKVEQSGLAFIGATSNQIALMGEKPQAIDFVRKLNVPVIPSFRGTVNEILDEVENLSFPLFVKASAGGGGKGMQVIANAEDLPLALRKTQRQGHKYFGNGDLFVEKYLPHARHIEVQIFGDGKGNVVHLFERECSIQRNYQKLIEEAPASSISASLKEKLYQTAVRIASEIQYRGAGTVEFLVDENQDFYFLEMNTRLQVEHPVTEMITGIDLVEWQIRVAAKQGLPLLQSEVKQNGHSIEMRLCAEDSMGNFLPASGSLKKIRIPEVSHVRFDSFIKEGMELSSAYDSMIGKLVVRASSREKARQKINDISEKLLITGIKTNLLFLQQIIKNDSFIKNETDTCFVENNLELFKKNIVKERKIISEIIPAVAYLLYHFGITDNPKSRWESQGYWRFHQEFIFEVEGQHVSALLKRKSGGIEIVINDFPFWLTNIERLGFRFKFQIDGQKTEALIFDFDGKTCVQVGSHRFYIRSNHILEEAVVYKNIDQQNEQNEVNIFADLFGRVVEIFVKPGDVVKKGEILLTIESMKSEFRILSPVSGVVRKLHFELGNLVKDKQLLVEFETKNNITVRV